jgi:nitroimidazol reductase NimA-like FMN-containing flavoprotein (pyridoxamine 5'-phosphate oxidase superfamily)
MFSEMRNIKRKLNEEEAIAILKKGQYGVLSTTGKNGYAYGVPVNYVYLDNNIYFHCATEGSKLDNIKYNDKVSFNVVCDVETVPENYTTKYSSTIIFGKAVEVYGEEKFTALLAIVEKYSEKYIESGKSYIKNADESVAVVKIIVEHIAGKANK